MFPANEVIGSSKKLCPALPSSPLVMNLGLILGWQSADCPQRMIMHKKEIIYLFTYLKTFVVQTRGKK